MFSRGQSAPFSSLRTLKSIKATMVGNWSVQNRRFSIEFHMEQDLHETAAGKCAMIELELELEDDNRVSNHSVLLNYKYFTYC